jgi:hypothetical protein
MFDVLSGIIITQKCKKVQFPCLLKETVPLHRRYGLIALLSLIPMSFIHAFVGRKLVESGMEMRVLWLYPKKK